MKVALDASMYQIPVDVQYGDELLTMVTCSNELEDGRLVIICRKQRDGETADDVALWMQAASEKTPVYPSVAA